LDSVWFKYSILSQKHQDRRKVSLILTLLLAGSVLLTTRFFLTALPTLNPAACWYMQFIAVVLSVCVVGFSLYGVACLVWRAWKSDRVVDFQLKLWRKLRSKPDILGPANHTMNKMDNLTNNVRFHNQLRRSSFSVIVIFDVR